MIREWGNGKCKIEVLSRVNRETQRSDRGTGVREISCIETKGTEIDEYSEVDSV